MATQFAGDGSYATAAAISAFRGVTLGSAGTIAASATGVIPVAIVQRDAGSGDYVRVKFFSGPGTHKISITGCPVTLGDAIFAGSSGQAYRSGGYITGALTVGIAGESASTNGTIITFVPTY